MCRLRLYETGYRTFYSTSITCLNAEKQKQKKNI